MAAALKNLELLEKDDAIEHMQEMGTKLVEGIVAIGQKHGYSVDFTGPPTMPTMTIRSDKDFALMHQFSSLMAEYGSFVHPTHNWFLCAKHSAADINDTLSHAEDTFQRMRTTLGRVD
jgi:glutamate-1-semialdehyde 2,1-aminomutase